MIAKVGQALLVSTAIFLGVANTPRGPPASPADASKGGRHALSATDVTTPYHALEGYKTMPWYYDEAGAPTSLKGKVAIVTGSSSGIGMGVATGLFRMGATVVVTSRSVAKAEKACKSIVQFVASDPRATDVAGALEPMALVLDDFESVAQFAKGFVAKHSALDYCMRRGEPRTVDLRSRSAASNPQ